MLESVKAATQDGQSMAENSATSGCQLKRLTKKLRGEEDSVALATQGKKKKKTMFSLQELLCKDVEALNTATTE